jgi:hypothetical protein
MVQNIILLVTIFLSFLLAFDHYIYKLLDIDHITSLETRMLCSQILLFVWIRRYGVYSSEPAADLHRLRSGW